MPVADGRATSFRGSDRDVIDNGKHTDVRCVKYYRMPDACGDVLHQLVVSRLLSDPSAPADESYTFSRFVEHALPIRRTVPTPTLRSLAMRLTPMP